MPGREVVVRLKTPTSDVRDIRGQVVTGDRQYTLARLLSGHVLYASIYMLLRLAISLAVLRNSPDAKRDLEILALRH